MPSSDARFRPMCDSDSDSDSRLIQKSDSNSDFDSILIFLIPIPIPIPAKNGIIPESIPIPESESCITGAKCPRTCYLAKSAPGPCFGIIFILLIVFSIELAALSLLLYAVKGVKCGEMGRKLFVGYTSH